MSPMPLSPRAVSYTHLADAPLKTCKYHGIRSRDHVIILFMYNTGARVSGVIGVKVKDVAMPPKRGMTMVTLHGKGRKERICPLWEDFLSLIHIYAFFRFL